MIAFFIIFAAVVLPMAIAIIAIVTEHQRKMAVIIHQNRGSVEADRLQALERQIGELTALVHQQTIALDSLTSRPLPENDRLEQRIGSGI